MSLPSSPPTVSQVNAPLKQGSTGWPVFALQSGLNAIRDATLKPDGDFGPATKETLESAQDAWGLTPDGIAGPGTREALSESICAKADRNTDAPEGLLSNFARGEGGNNPAAVNWSVGGGVDCGLFQFRVYGPPYGLAALKAAFSPYKSALMAEQDFTQRQRSYLGAAWVGQNKERAGRCAVMAHNWPAGALKIAYTGKCSSPYDRCTWLPRDGRGVSLVKFPDGTRVETRWQWCQFYGLGSLHGEAVMCRDVKW